MRKDDRDRKRRLKERGRERKQALRHLMCVPTGNDHAGGLAGVMAFIGLLDVGVFKI